MSEKKSQTPEFLQIKGYKYRAKMLIAAAVILIVIIIIICSIIHSISSAIKGRSQKDTETDISSDTETYISEIVSEEIDSEIASSASESTSSANLKGEKTDANGKLIIDTDTLDGKKAVAITFDDGPGQYTERLLEGLKERNARATFFMVGSCVEQYPETLPLMVQGGHQLGNHTYNHTDITTISNKEMNDQITKTDDAIFNACGQRSTAFRPPYGAHTNDTNLAIDKTITLWSLDTEDWNKDSAESVRDIIVSKCKDGDIILLHDIHETSVDGALLAIDELQKQGYLFVTVNELLTRYGYDIEPHTTHSSQYSVYETNSPHAKDYEAEVNSRKAAEAASAASNEFYTKDSDSEQEEYNYEEDVIYDDEDDGTIRVITTDSENKRLVY